MVVLHLLFALKSLTRRERGATIVEYGIVVAVIAVVALFSITTLGHDVLSSFTHAERQLPHPSHASTCCDPGGGSSSSPSSTTTSTTTTTTPPG